MKIITSLSLITLLFSCGLADMMNRTDKMTKIIFSNCDCDNVKLLNYEDNTLGTITAYIEIIGSDVNKRDSIVNKINTSLKEGITDFCDIDNLTLDFINKGKSYLISIENCNVKK